MSRKRSRPVRPEEMPAGVMGLGLMGHSIIACLLSAGHPVTAFTRSLAKHRGTRGRILKLLREMRREGLLKRQPTALIRNLRISEDCRGLSGCAIVLESIIENLETKKLAYRLIEESVSRRTIIGSNTSSIPVSLLQQGALHPKRFVGIHWDEPAHVTRFMEITCGERTDQRYAKRVMALAAIWGKEPSLCRRDVRGLITNRVSYAMFREACHLVDSGVATVGDVDRSLRNDVGWWMPFAGPFRYMDLMGRELQARYEGPAARFVHQPQNSLAHTEGRGFRWTRIANGNWFYRYTTAQARRWEKLFLKFNYDVRRLAMKYPEDFGNRASSNSTG
jgi:3-hydroxybutyryl-CoA dehydrogenase